jgi:hypothetical protein
MQFIEDRWRDGRAFTAGDEDLGRCDLLASRLHLEHPLVHELDVFCCNKGQQLSSQCVVRGAREKERGWWWVGSPWMRWMPFSSILGFQFSAALSM